MATATPRWGFERLDAKELGAQVKINHLFDIWDSLINCAFVSVTVTAQPVPFGNGAVYAIPASPTATGIDWTGNNSKIAIFFDKWWFFPLLVGMTGLVANEFEVFDGTNWQIIKLSP